MLPPFIPPLAARGLNALLDREVWARQRLRTHAGKSVRIVAGSLDLLLAIGADGRVSTGAGPANVTARVAAADLPRLLDADPAQRLSAVHIEGEAALAHAVADLARDLRWDVEDELAQRLGDLPARLLVRGVTGVAQAVREGATRLTQNASEYAVHEAGLLAAPEAVHAWAREVSTLDDAVRGLQSRVDALTRIRSRA